MWGGGGGVLFWDGCSMRPIPKALSLRAGRGGRGRGQGGRARGVCE